MRISCGGKEETSDWEERSSISYWELLSAVGETKQSNRGGYEFRAVVEAIQEVSNFVNSLKSNGEDAALIEDCMARISNSALFLSIGQPRV